MANPLSADTLAGIQQTAAQISVAHDLDSEIQSELRSHLEEKLLAYLSGQEKLSEPDALLLTRAHFGNPATIKSLFQRAHPRAYRLSLARRLIAAFVVTLGIPFLLQIPWGLLQRFLEAPIVTASGPRAPMALAIAFAAISLTAGLIKTFVLWKILAYWRRGMAQGRRFWFQTWSIYTLLLLAPAVWFLARLPIGFMMFDRSLPNPDLGLLLPIANVLGFIFSAVTILLWLWWCDQAPYARRAMLYTAACWSGYHAIVMLTDMAVQVRIIGPGVLPEFHQLWVHHVIVLPLLEFLARFLLAIVVLAAYLLYRRHRLPAPASPA